MKKWINAMICLLIVTSCNTNESNKETEQSSDKTTEMTELFPKPNVEIKTVGILLYDGFANLDAIGPFAVFSSLMGTDVFFVGMEKGLVTDARGMKVQVDKTISDVQHLDILVIPGGFKETYELTNNEELLSWIRKIDSTSKYTASVCTGAWILGATGLLKGKEATTHWWAKEILAEKYGAKIKDTRYANSGKYWTSAGVTAGMDMSLAMLKEIAGEKYTKIVMLDLEYDPHPPIKGGSETNTDRDLVETKRAMYDGGMEAILNPDKISASAHLANDRDYICGMAVTKNTVDTVHYNGKVYGFCSSACKKRFKENPSSYLK